MRPSVVALEEHYYPLSAARVCRRVVLDTNVAWHASIAQLQELQRRGFLLSLSLVPFTEAVARAYRVGAAEMAALSARARWLDPVLESALPFAPLASGICQQLGRPVPGYDQGDESWPRLERALVKLWAQLKGGSVAGWDEMGKALDAGLTSDAQWMVKDVDSKKWAPAKNAARRDPLAAIERVARWLAGRVARRYPLPGGPYLRLNAFVHMWAHNVVRYGMLGSGQPSENDREDWRLLQHLSAPAFIATADARFIKRVIESRTHQAPWVRTLDNLVGGKDLPIGRPCGPTARVEAMRYARTLKRG